MGAFLNSSTSALLTSGHQLGPLARQLASLLVLVMHHLTKSEGVLGQGSKSTWTGLGSVLWTIWFLFHVAELYLRTCQKNIFSLTNSLNCTKVTHSKRFVTLSLTLSSCSLHHMICHFLLLG